MTTAGRRTWAAAVVLLVVTLSSGCRTAGTDAEGPVDGGYVAGDGSIVMLPERERDPAPSLSATTFDGNTFNLADERGNVVVLNVWASWCAPCRAEAPALVAIAEEFTPRGVQFIGLNIRDSDTAARAFVEKFAIPYANIADRDGRLQLLFSDSLPPSAIPSTLVIDAEGRVAGRALGRVSAATLRGMIAPLLPPLPSP